MTSKPINLKQKIDHDLETWIQEIVVRVNNFQPVSYRDLKVALHGKLSEGFDPFTFKNELFSAPNEVSLLGFVEYDKANDWKNICHLVLSFIQRKLKGEVNRNKFTRTEISQWIGESERRVSQALTMLRPLGYFLSSWSGNPYEIDSFQITMDSSFAEILNYKDIDMLIASYKAQFVKQKIRRIKNTEKPVNKNKTENVWSEIEKDYEISKVGLGRKIRFVREDFVREILFRDIADAYNLAHLGYSKPAVILTGGVMEELLRQYLIYKKVTLMGNTFDSYLKSCEDAGLLKSAIHKLTDSFRHFRNLVHIEKETSSRHTLSKATAISAVSSLFTLVNDFGK